MRQSRRSVLLVGCLCGSACDEPPADAGHPRDVLAACGLPEPCTTAVYESVPGVADEPATRCVLAALSGEDPVHVTGLFVTNTGDAGSSRQFDVFRWADGSATCVEDSNDEVTVRACEATTREECRGLAEDDPLPLACNTWPEWGIEQGAPTTAVCH